MATTQPSTRPDHAPTPVTPRTTPPLGRRVLANLPIAELVEDAIRAGEGLIAAEGPLVVRTGKHTGRSPQDKFIVDEPSSAGKIWWGDVNHRISEANYDRLRARLVAYCAEKDLYSQDLLIGADPAHRRRLPSTPRRPGRASSPATCSAAPDPLISPGSSPTSRSSTCRRSTRIRRRRAPGPARRSSSTSSGWRSSSSAPSTPGRSRSLPSRS